MTDPVPNLGDEATAILFDAIDFAVREAETTETGFVPFVLSVAGDGEKIATRYVDDEENFTVEGSVRLARESLRGTDPSTRCVALAWDGFLTLGEDRTEAVFAEAYELDRPEGVMFAQRYVRGSDGLDLIGNPLLLHQRPEPLVPRAEPADARAEAIARIQALADRRKQNPR